MKESHPRLADVVCADGGARGRYVDCDQPEKQAPEASARATAGMPRPINRPSPLRGAAGILPQMAATCDDLARRDFLGGSAAAALTTISGCGGRSGPLEQPPVGELQDPAAAEGGRDASASGGTDGKAGQTGGDGWSGDSGGAGSSRDADSTCEATSADIEGPFFKPDSPEQQRIAPDMLPGHRLTLRGRVLSHDCKPLPNVVVDFWQCDVDGVYANTGFVLRGHQRTAADGTYRLETIVPGRYLNGSQYRPAHIHVKVYVGMQEELTTQLYFEGDPYNSVDPWYKPENALAPAATATSALVADYDFVV